MWNFILALLLVPAPAWPALVKVDVYHEEDTCVAKLDTKKMSKQEFAKLTELYKFLGYPFDQDPLGFLNKRHKIEETRALIAKNKKFIEDSIQSIPSFRRPRWKKLSQHILTNARVGREKQLAALAFMDTWDPKPLLRSEKPEDALAYQPEVEWIENDSPEKQEQRRAAEKKRLLALPLEERPTNLLTCDQRLRILADDSRLEKFSAIFVKHTCESNGSPDACEQDYLINPGMTKPEREGRRMYLFQWAWYNNNECPYTRAIEKESNYDEDKRGSLKELYHSALRGLECESNGCED